MQESDTPEAILKALRRYIRYRRGTIEDPENGVTVELTLGGHTYTGHGLSSPEEWNTAAMTLIRAAIWVDDQEKKERKITRQRGSSVRDSR